MSPTETLHLITVIYCGVHEVIFFITCVNERILYNKKSNRGNGRGAVHHNDNYKWHSPDNDSAFLKTSNGLLLIQVRSSSSRDAMPTRQDPIISVTLSCPLYLSPSTKCELFSLNDGDGTTYPIPCHVGNNASTLSGCGRLRLVPSEYSRNRMSTIPEFTKSVPECTRFCSIGNKVYGQKNMAGRRCWLFCCKSAEICGESKETPINDRRPLKTVRTLRVQYSSCLLYTSRCV